MPFTLSELLFYSVRLFGFLPLKNWMKNVSDSTTVTIFQVREYLQMNDASIKNVP